MRRFFRELEVAGYVTRRRMRKADGRSRWQIDSTESPPTKPVHARTTGGTAVDGQGVDLPQTLNIPKLDKCNPTTTAASRADIGRDTDRADGELCYPDCLRRVPVESLYRLLAGCPLDLRQLVLDEVDAMHKIGKVRSPVGLLSVLARKAGLGQFSPNYSLRVGRSRTMAELRTEDRRDGISKSRWGQAVAVSELGRRVLSGLR